MKTVLFTPSYLEGLDPLGSSRLARNLRYIEYYSDLKDHGHLHFDDIWLADNASKHSSIEALQELTTDYFQIHRFEENLVRGKGPYDYPYCWRALYFMQDLIRMGYKKIIFIDSDSFIVSQRLADYINEVKYGWTAFWSEKYKFPTAECHVLCEDSFYLLDKFCQVSWEHRIGTLMETQIPFTHVIKEFKCDRYGETRILQTDDMDGYFQAPVNLELKFKS